MKWLIADQGHNRYGNELNQLVIEADFSILNGTRFEQSGGGLACFTQPNHPTTIDMSDLCPILLITKIKTSLEDPTQPTWSWARSAEPAKAHWSKEEELDIAHNLGSETNKKD